MTQSNLDFHAIADDARSIAAGRQESPQWLVGALRTFEPSDPGLANLPHRARAEVLVIASARNKGEAIVPVAELVEAEGPLTRLLRTGIDGLSVTSPPLASANHPNRGRPLLLDELVTNRQTDPEDLRYTVAPALQASLLRRGVLPRNGPERTESFIAEISVHVRPKQPPEHDILIRAIAGPGPCAWCLHRRLGHAVTTPTALPRDWPHETRVEAALAELIVMQRTGGGHAFVTAYLSPDAMPDAWWIVRALGEG